MVAINTYKLRPIVLTKVSMNNALQSSALFIETSSQKLQVDYRNHAHSTMHELVLKTLHVYHRIWVATSSQMSPPRIQKPSNR